eukprot:TRINITY_DN66960_c0_g4_i2.p1 TRINITY_DN66960_c0_g4~~TRINITY_DN66960_c0_g4_i2.p1  ORF type:complete len:123 (+),score=3.02 TRINITY_DN66960_c0_g4_i2:31-369(+)
MATHPPKECHPFAASSISSKGILAGPVLAFHRTQIPTGLILGPYSQQVQCCHPGPPENPTYPTEQGLTIYSGNLEQPKPAIETQQLSYDDGDGVRGCFPAVPVTGKAGPVGP